MFSKRKAVLRRAGVRTREALEAAIREALEAVSAADARSWFARCGYQLPPPAAPQQSL